MNKKKRTSLLQLYVPQTGVSIEHASQRKALPKSTKNAKKGPNTGLRTYTPPPQQQRIKQKYMDGMSIRRIAREEHKARETVTKIVRSPEMDEIVEEIKEKLIALADKCVERITHAVQFEKDGGWLAFELAERWGAIPPKPHVICRFCGRKL